MSFVLRSSFFSSIHRKLMGTQATCYCYIDLPVYNKPGTVRVGKNPGSLSKTQNPKNQVGFWVWGLGFWVFVCMNQMFVRIIIFKSDFYDAQTNFLLFASPSTVSQQTKQEYEDIEPTTSAVTQRSFLHAQCIRCSHWRAKSFNSVKETLFFFETIFIWI